MKYVVLALRLALPCRAPRGARGLKYEDGVEIKVFTGKSRPSRGARVEICRSLLPFTLGGVAPLAGRAG